jgi:hypothetical protein
MKRFLWLFVIVFLFLICTGCGDTFRPVIIPNPPKFPDPRASHSVVAISDNNTDLSQVPPQSNSGTVMSVNVSGDTVVGVADVGLAPVHAVQQTASQVLVVNHSVTGAIGDSLTKVTFSGTQISNTTTISLPPDSAPNFVASTESGTAYVTLPNYVPDPIGHPDIVVPSVGVLSTLTNSLLTTIPVQDNPLAVAETPDAKKFYVANNGASTISNFNTIDRTPRNSSPIALSSPPLWLATRSDSQRVYVLETNGTIGTLDTTATAGPDTLTESSFTIPGASYMVYDGHLNRLYIPSTDLSDTVNPARLAVVDVSGSQPAAPVVVKVTTVPPSSRVALDPCVSTAATTLTAASAAALPDGSRVYLGSFYTDGAGNICPQVTAINTSSNTIKNTTAVPGFPGFAPFSPPICALRRFRFTMAAGGDSSRVYLASCDGGNINVVDTSTDTYLLNLPAPGSSRPPINGNQPPPQNPVFMIAGP